MAVRVRTLNSTLKKRLQALELYTYLRILLILYHTNIFRKVTNETIMKKIKIEQSKLLDSIKILKQKYLGRIMRDQKYEVLRLILENWKISGILTELVDGGPSTLDGLFFISTLVPCSRVKNHRSFVADHCLRNGEDK